MRRRPLLLLALCLGCAPLPAAAADRPAPATPRLEIAVSPTANLIHWVDNLAGSSAGKTIAVYRRYWEERFGPYSALDREHLDRFARIRSLAIPFPIRIGNARGCLPVDEERLNWRQIFKSESMQAESIDDFAARLAPRLALPERDALVACLRHFQPRFERSFRQMGHVRRFRQRLDRFLKDGRLPAYLKEVADLFEVDASALPPMRVSLIALPEDGPTHAEADGDDLLVEIRPNDSPVQQIQVLSHEATHFIMRRMTVAQIDRLAAQAYGASESGALVWRYMWEGFPTALGQGVAEARLAPEIFSLARPWYHLEVIDRFARAVYPVFSQALRDGRPLERGEVMAQVARRIQESPLYREATADEFLMTAFYATGEGFAPAAAAMRGALGVPRDAGGSFALEDPAGRALLERYSCMGGVLLVRPDEIARAASLAGMPPVPDETVQRARRMIEAGHGFIIPGRRPAGGLIFLLVARGPESAGDVVEAFLRRRGIPDRPLVVPSASRPSAAP